MKIALKKLEKVIKYIFRNKLVIDFLCLFLYSTKLRQKLSSKIVKLPPSINIKIWYNLYKIRKIYLKKAKASKKHHAHDEYRLTIFVPTYNAEKTLAKTLDSILSQKTNFKFKILIADDCSTDASKSIILRYQQKYSNIIFPIYRSINLGLVQNHYQTLTNHIDTEYFTTLDADDYYTDNQKLQLQVDALDNNFTCSYCAHQFSILDGSNNTVALENIAKNTILNKLYYTHTSTKMYRATVLDFIKDKNPLLTVDASLGAISFYLGKIYFIAKNMSCYVYSQQGTWSSRSTFIQEKMNLFSSTMIYYYSNKTINSGFIDGKLLSDIDFLTTFDSHNYNKPEFLKANLFYYKSENVGDVLSLYTQYALGNKRVEYVEPSDANITSIGSLMECFLQVNTESDILTRPSPHLDIWGTGFHFEEQKHWYRNNIIFPEVFDRKVTIHALRGQLSKKRAEKILNKKLDSIALGDPGLLVSAIFPYIRPLTRKYRVGIVAHFLDKNLHFFKELNDKLQNSILINVEQTPDIFIQEMLNCDVIISTAMHPLIMADSYNIPNRWIYIQNKNVSKYKIDDYYSVFNKTTSYIDVENEKISNLTINNIEKEYDIKREEVLKIQKELLSAYPYKLELKTLTETDLKILAARAK